MADDSDQEKTEDPTGKRLDEARKEGQIPRSKELGTLAVLLFGMITVNLFGGGMLGSLWQLMERDLRLARRDLFDDKAMMGHLAADLSTAMGLLIPVLAVTTVAAIVAPIALGGWNVSFAALTPKLSKFNPISGLARMVSPHSATELFKSLLKIALIGGITYLLYRHYEPRLLTLTRLNLRAAASDSLHILMVCMVWLCASLVLIAGIDVPFQLWSHQRKLKMSKQEVKDEARDAEGKPEVKGRIRTLQMEMSRRRMMEEVPRADVVVTNPTHFAIALKYDQGLMAAPRVLAKGTDLIAAQIRNLANGAKIPLLSAPPLARALYFSTDLGKEIPPGLYLAVAQVLAYIYQLRAYKQFGGPIPAPLGDIEVPAEYRRDERGRTPSAP